MVEFIEQQLLYFRKEFVRCIKDPTILSFLAADSVITEDENTRLKYLYISGVDKMETTEDLVDCILQSKQPGKWKSLMHALEESGYHYLKKLLESSDRTDEKSNRQRQIITVFAPYLEKAVVARDIVADLRAMDVLNDQDSEAIISTYELRGATYSTIVLLDRMQCRKSPAEWYYHFLKALLEKDYTHVIEQIEPDFLKCPQQFDPRAVNSFERDTALPGTSGSMTEKFAQSFGKEGTPGSPREHVIHDFVPTKESMDVEGMQNQTGCFDALTGSDSEDMSNEKALNNLNARPPPDGHALEEKEESKINLTAFNIKPDVTKNVQIGNSVNITDDKQSDPDLEVNDSEDSHGDYDEDVAGTCSNYQLRSYQLELAENALAGKNTIICAPTGSGKTWVALHIIEEHLRQNKNAKRPVVFMARNGALVKQQVDRVNKHLPQRKVKHLVGDTEEAQMMPAFLGDFDIFCFTPQILVNNLEKGVKSLAKFSLMIFDECHHTKGGEPYLMLMRRYLVEKSKGIKFLPQIVGLTASPGSGNAKTENDALEYIIKLCACLDVRCLSTVEKNTESLQKQCSIPTEETIPMKKRSYDPCRGILLEAMGKIEDILVDKVTFEQAMMKILFDKPKDRESKQYKMWTGNAIKTAETLTNTSGRDSRACASYLQTYSDALEVNGLLETRNVSAYLNQKMSQENESSDRLNEVETKLLQNLKGVQKELIEVCADNPNVHVLSQALKAHFSNEDEESRAMVFVEARATCRALVDFLNKELDDVELKVGLLIGKENRGGDKGMTEIEQTSVVEDFRNGFYKVLVVTSIGIEGIDVPDCNMILDYNYHGNEITKIQMKGRSRKGGKNIMIAAETQMLRNKISMYRIHLMKKALEQFKRLDAAVINRKVLAFQRKEQDQYESWRRTNEFKRQKQTDETDYQVQCRRCQKDLFNASDIRKLDTSNIHLIAVRDFENKIKRDSGSDIKRPRMGVLTKKCKMFCKFCPNYLGVIGVKKDMDAEFYVLKLEGLRFVNDLNPHQITTYGSWLQMPYKVREISTLELDRIYETEDKNKTS